jgi:hypothetical protein
VARALAVVLAAAGALALAACADRDAGNGAGDPDLLLDRTVAPGVDGVSVLFQVASPADVEVLVEGPAERTARVRLGPPAALDARSREWLPVPTGSTDVRAVGRATADLHLGTTGPWVARVAPVPGAMGEHATCEVHVRIRRKPPAPGP